MRLPHSDVWSVGVFWETLRIDTSTGRADQEVARTIQEGAPLATSGDLPADCAAVDAALAPARRPALPDLAAELRNALRARRSASKPYA
jgi:hypothetical protein